MGKSFKIIQLAATCSNLGDNANISGLRWLIQTTFPETTFEFTDWDIVDYSWSRKYTEADIDFVNSHDLLIVGGGGFFEILPNSPSWTGTRFNLPEALFNRIRIPVMFHALGTHRLRADLAGVDLGPQIDRFGRFLDRLQADDRFFLAFRHDGSRQSLRRTYGDAVADKATVVADAGLYAQIPPDSPWSGARLPEGLTGAPLLAVNFGGDLLEARFPQGGTAYDLVGQNRWKHPPDYEKPRIVDHAGFMQFVEGFSDVLRGWMDRCPEMRVVFVPHIYRDLQVGAALLTELGFPYNRRRATMAPYLHGTDGYEYIFDFYRRCDCVVGMRFHANVTPFGFGVPTVGLATFPMVHGFYEEIGCADRLVDTSRTDAMTRLDELIGHSLREGPAIREQYASVRVGLEARSRDFIRQLAPLIGGK